MLTHVASYFGGILSWPCLVQRDVSINECRKRCLKGVNEHPKTNLSVKSQQLIWLFAKAAFMEDTVSITDIH